MTIVKFEMMLGNPLPKESKKVVGYHAFDMYGLRFVVHRKNGNKHSKKWEVSEVTSGCGLCLPEDYTTPLQAVKAGKKYVAEKDIQFVMRKYYEALLKISLMTEKSRRK